ncbi:hypothetical protein HDU85_003528 [Gaertneriomyces sp. JEL0708]|nr:hypothetical protein HDU85_003528 [Gaertneriomyces sp. JEL0708]
MAHQDAPTFASISTLNNLSESDFSSQLSLLFEPAPPLTQALIAQRPFESYLSLLDKASSIIESLPEHEKVFVINAHPRIGEAKKNLSALSFQEQGYATQTAEDPEVMERLRLLNEAYEKKYGFKFVVFVNGRPKKEIIPVFEERLNHGTRDGELRTGLTDMILIARDRLKKLSNQ